MKPLAITLLLGLLIVIAFFLFRLNPPPLDRLQALEDKARRTIEETGARDIVAEDVESIENRLSNLRLDIDDEGSRLPFLRDFSQFEDRFVQLENDVDGLRSLVVQHAREAEKGWDDKMQALVNLANQIDDELTDAPLGKGSAAIIGSMRDDLAGLRNEVAEAQLSRSQGNVMEAFRKLDVVEFKAKQLLAEITDAKEKARALREREGF